jgi:plasmid stability protein
MPEIHTRPWAVTMQFSRNVKEWIEARAKRHHRSMLGELRAIVGAAMDADFEAEKAAHTETLR